MALPTTMSLNKKSNQINRGDGMLISSLCLSGAIPSYAEWSYNA